MPNRLADETSPYLLQHAENPVAWQPWDEAALAEAKQRQTPIFLSIGYSACHWCHVMEHESFSDPAVAKLLNDHFVCIKVDREERPDLDSVYMTAVQMLTGRGGWPMSVFLTPDLQPFYGGTYWPPNDRHGMPGFPRVLEAVIDAWDKRREQAKSQGAQLQERIAQVERRGTNGAKINEQLLQGALATMEQHYDPQYGGFGDAPKFPHAMHLQFLLRLNHRGWGDRALAMATETLDRMAAGGMYDQLGGGFHRYSVDARWHTPHFEKMLYDNALLAGAYTEAYQATGEERYALIARQTLDYLLRDMLDPAGGFHSSEDADSESVEGKFYVWSYEEVIEVLGEDEGALFARVYDVTPSGNFEGTNIPHLPKTLSQQAQWLHLAEPELKRRLDNSKEKLLVRRATRIRPGKDDKVLANWNGFAIRALAQAAGVIDVDEPRYLKAAQRAADFALTHMRDEQGRLLHSWRDGRAKQLGFLDDYAALAWACVALFETSGEGRWIDAACALADDMLTLFRDPDGGFLYTSSEHDFALVRHKDLYESSTPSGASLAATVLLQLAEVTGRDAYAQAAAETLTGAVWLMQENPLSAGQMLLAADLLIGPQSALVLAPGESDVEQLTAELRNAFIPHGLKAVADEENVTATVAPLLQDKSPVDGQSALYVCRGRSCLAPVVGREAILTELNKLSSPR